MSHVKQILTEDDTSPRWYVRQWRRFLQWIKVPQLEGHSQFRSFSIDDMDEYREAQAQRKQRWPIRWMISETIPNCWDKTVTNCWTTPKDWVRFRTWDRYDRIRIPSLTPGYYDKDRIMLHGMFDLLVDFVEIELASMNFTYWEEQGIKRPRMRDRTRCVEAGIKHLEWEIQHTHPQQQDIARTKLELYTWWTVTRPQREEPWSWNVIWSHDSTGNRLPYSDHSGELASHLDNYYDQEDQEMLKRLVDIRFSLWS